SDGMDFIGPSTSTIAIALDGKANGGRYSPASSKKSTLDTSRLRTSSQNSSQASFRDSEQRSLHSDHTNQNGDAMNTVEFSRDSWNRLREHVTTLRRSEETAAEYRRLLDEDHSIQAALTNRELASVKQNAELSLERLTRKVAAMKMRVTKKKMGACDITQAQDKKEMGMHELRMRILKMEEECTTSEEEMTRLRPRLHVLRELLKHRRKQMIEDVIDHFPILTDSAPPPSLTVSTKCACPERHFIRSIHLPWTTRLPGHDDTSLTAGFALLVQMLQLFSSITDSHLRYPLELRAAGAEIATSDGISLSLVSNARYKADRARLDAATTLLLRNLAQLRSDCGVHTKRMERTLFVLDDILRVLARGEQGEMPAVFTRPWECSYSLASLMEQPEDDGKSVVVLHRPLPTDEEEDPSFLSQGVEVEEEEKE
ncbi:hypothetical protein PFISCL1PPCAC_25040, partial [Pristionchus fissidentatus]